MPLMSGKRSKSRSLDSTVSTPCSRHRANGQPGASDRMQRKLGTVGVDQDIRIDVNHDTARRCSTWSRYSSRVALLSMLTVGIRLPWVTGRSSRKSAGAGSASVLRRASEIRALASSLGWARGFLPCHSCGAIPV